VPKNRNRYVVSSTSHPYVQNQVIRGRLSVGSANQIPDLVSFRLPNFPSLQVCLNEYSYCQIAFHTKSIFSLQSYFIKDKILL
jgi:hypothetical protein